MVKVPKDLTTLGAKYRIIKEEKSAKFTRKCMFTMMTMRMLIMMTIIKDDHHVDDNDQTGNYELSSSAASQHFSKMNRIR